MIKYSYFVHFNCTNTLTGAKGYGNAILEIDEKINSNDQIRKIEERIPRDNPVWKKVVLTNFIFLREVENAD